MSVHFMQYTTKESFEVIGMACPLTPVDAPKVWHDFIQHVPRIEGRVNSTESMGVCDERNKRYIACVEVEAGTEAPPGLIRFTVPANEYVVFQHRGSILGIGETLCEIGSWLTEHGYKETNKPPFFELYDEHYKGEAEDSEFDLYISLEKKVV